jgi:molybdate transport system ATP-binding protein
VIDPARVLSFDVSVRQGDFTLDLRWQGPLGLLGVWGPSGAGKTTLLEVIAGLRPPERGRVAFGSRILTDTGGRVAVPPRDRGIGYAPQEASLFPHLTVRQNVLYGSRRDPSARPLDAALEMLEIAPLIDRGTSGLSGGERQRISLARALLSGPSLLLLDEPLSAVDATRRSRIVSRLLAWLRERRLPAVYVSHDAGELETADHMLVLGT